MGVTNLRTFGTPALFRSAEEVGIGVAEEATRVESPSLRPRQINK
ncbi:unnamed protein product [Spirodela intermedia]|uniref:Uncharacterized protein n=1 Tax=Spirodela intermedia TaxID=51605 RepID=A0A7I8JMS4_SPIIN|nr:unnamed protein product [Spirodela intermedia]CAA6671448.1 unnamed protein product [Spirodela intermedia]